MRQPAPNALRLPRQLRDELGVSDVNYNDPRKRRGGPTKRKEQRKAARVGKRSSHASAHSARRIKTRLKHDHEEDRPKIQIVVAQPQTKATSAHPRAPKSILEISKSDTQAREASNYEKTAFPPPSANISRGVRDKLAEDDAEITALEKALGVKGKKLPKSFVDDGLDDLLDGIEEAAEFRPDKRKRSESEEWLKTKRQKDTVGITYAEVLDGNSTTGREGSIGESVSDGLSEDDGELTEDSGAEEDDGFASFEGKDEYPSKYVRTKDKRENPYVAPVTWPTPMKEGKYIPPSLRSKELKGSEDLSQLQRQTQGLLNRLSEANLSSIVNDIEKLFRDHPRQYVSTTLLDLLMGLLSDPTSLQDTFIILHAGFIAAVYKVSGFDFGAQAVERIYKEFVQYYDPDADHENMGKRPSNLIRLLAELYNFQVISCNLIYDFVRLFLDKLSESNTELLLRIVRNSGPQLRHDDPLSLKNILLQLQKALASAGEENLSVRTKFMVETLNNLKNNRMKTGIAASTITSEHTIRMKKTLGSLNQRNIRASEPLRVGLKDLQDTDRRGKWWLIRASYKGDATSRETQEEQLSTKQHLNEDDLAMKEVGADLARLAKEQRMNTDVRRSIFVAIMSSTDFNDAYVRLMKLGLKRSQELEIPKVLIHCAGAEKIYNPFYTFLSRRVCSDKKLKRAFQFSLWDAFKRMGEGENEPEDQENEEEGKLGLRSIVNLARMFGVLVAEGGLSVGILKNLNLAYLQPKIKIFVELMLISAIMHSQQEVEGSRDEKALRDIFLKPKEIPELAGGLHYFLRKVVSKTDIFGSDSDKETVRWGCRVAGNALTAMAS
ncbi:hypothetical protein N7G274_002149 [Stereocaulon virgatum]|uniref:MI domain-containing protein n=1 Tax=Stereocaulon virgatum TaxID=373712 RepID=A0ABR4AIX0_9LECA